MATMTIRVLADLNKTLDSLSAETGILKSSLILYAINDTLRLRPDQGEDLFTFSQEEPVRMTLRIPDTLKTLLESTAKNNKVSANFLINQCIYSENLLFWAEYKPLAKVQKESAGKSESPSRRASSKGRNTNRSEDAQ